MSLCRTTHTTNSPDNFYNDNKDRRSFKQRDDDDASYVFANVKEREKERERETKINPTSDCIKSNESNYCLLVFYQKCVFLLLIELLPKTSRNLNTLNTSQEKKGRVSGENFSSELEFTPDSPTLSSRARKSVFHTYC
jgi:hypothetical protein